MTFGVAAFLWAAVAGIIPVVLHMINRQHAPVVYFSTLRFLRLSVHRTRRRKRLHDLLLLLLRVAALVLLAIALAQPAVSWLHRWMTGQSSTSVVLILDNSGSLATKDQNGPRWDRLRSAALQILDELREADEVALLVTNGPARQSVRGLSRNHEIVRRAVRTCRPSFERADLVAAVSEARRLLRSAPVTASEIYIVTDMQACCWNDLQRPAETAERDDAGCPIVMVDVSGPRLSNSALLAITTEATAPVAGAPLRVTVDLQGDAQVAEERHVSIYLDSQKRDTSSTLRIEPAERVRHTFQLTLSGSGLHRGHLQLEEEDACPADDRLWFAANTDPSVRVAIVKNAAHEIANLDQAYYLERALTLRNDPHGAFLVSSLAPASLASMSLAQFDLIFCVDLPAPELAVAQQLVAYVEKGGHLIWISGEHVDPVAYSVMDNQVQGRLLPTRLFGVQRENVERPEGWRIAWIDPLDAAVAPFAEPASIHQSVLITRFMKIAPTAAPGVQVLARMDDGQPLLVRRRVGAGSTCLLATSLHVDWTNFPLKPLFLPFLTHFAFQLAGAEANQPVLLPGDPWQLPLSADDDTIVEVVRPGGEVVRPVREEANPNVIHFQDTHEVGVYEVRIHRGPHVRTAAFAVNPDPEEAAPGYVTAAQLEQLLAPHRLFLCHDATRVSQTIRDLRKGWPLGGVILTLVIVALVAETFQANRREYRVPPV